jgi:tetratricopeptide (TPR) repeat protein
MEEIDGPVHPDIANLSYSLGGILERRDRHAEAEACAARAVRIMDEVADLVEGPEAELILIQSLGLLGTTLRQQGRYREAEPALSRAVERAEAYPDRDALALALNDFGVLCKYSGRFDEGERAYRRALAISLESCGEIHPTVAVLYHNLGGLDHARSLCRRGAASPAGLGDSPGAAWPGPSGCARRRLRVCGCPRWARTL